MDQVLKDKRFSHVTKDPRFRQMSKQERKIKIDNRFKGMFSDKKFKLKYSVDKRGRPIQATTNENLRKFYELDDDDDDDDNDKEEEEENDSDDQADGDDVSDEEEIEVKNIKNKILKTKTRNNKKIEENIEQVSKKKSNKKLKSDSEDLSDEESENEDAQISSKEKKMKGLKAKIIKQKGKPDHDGDSGESSDSGVEKSADDKKKKKKKGQVLVTEPDFARGEGNIESSSDEEGEGDEYNSEDEEFDHQWGELDKEVEEATELSNRLAVCNLDWDRIKAQDIFVSLNSFKPPNGVIHSVKIYPSEYGLQRMKEESVKGPMELVAGAKKQEDEDDKDLDTEDREGSKYHREKLRQYQLNRLKYYYAVVECDSVNTANQIYEECDGLEYETSASKLDLRFIPDGMEFDQEPKSTCTEMPPASTYKPTLFLTSALCQSKVDLTWDETDKDRMNVTMKKITKKDEIKEEDFKAYLAGSSDEEGPAYYGAFNFDQDDDDDDGTDSEDEQAQIDKYRKLAQNIKEQEKKHETKDVEMEITWEPGLREATEKIIKKKEETKNATPWEEYLAKKKEKKKAIREQKKKDKSDKQQGSDNETDDKSGEEEAAFSDDELPAGVDLNDPFFSDELKDNNNKTDKKKGKKKSKKGRKDNIDDDSEKAKEEAELDLLMMDDTEDNKRHFNLKNLIEDGKKKKKKKKLKAKEKSKTVDDDFEMDVKDERFNAIYTSHLYNIDPSAPEYKKTKAMGNVIKEKLDRRQKEDKKVKKKEMMKRSLEEDNDVNEKHKKRKGEMNTDKYPVTNESLDSLVKSVKLKTQKFKNKFKT